MQSSKKLCSLPKPYLCNRLHPCPFQSTCLPFFRRSPKQSPYNMKISIPITLVCVMINTLTEMHWFGGGILFWGSFCELISWSHYNKIITNLMAYNNNKNMISQSRNKSSKSRCWQSPIPSIGLEDSGFLPSSSSSLTIVNLSWWLQVTLSWRLCCSMFCPPSLWVSLWTIQTTEVGSKQSYFASL